MESPLKQDQEDECKKIIFVNGEKSELCVRDSRQEIREKEDREEIECSQVGFQRRL